MTDRLEAYPTKQSFQLKRTMNMILSRPIARAVLLAFVWVASGLSGIADEPTRRQANKPIQADGKTVIPKSTLDRLNERLDVTYAKYGERTLLMDIFSPEQADRPLPAIVCIHGGGWRKGSKIHHRKVAQALAAEGYVTASIDYRLSGEAVFPAHIQDCKAAVRYLRANAKELGIDADHIGAIGHSAGGHLAALLATSGGVAELEGEGGNGEFSSAIQAVVPMGGQTDFLSERNRGKSASADIWQQFLGGSQDEVRETYRLASPLEHLDKNDPPVWLITGEKDDPSTRAASLRQKMDEFDIPNGLTVIKDAPHPFTVKQVWFDQMIDAAVPFFERTLKQQTTPSQQPVPLFDGNTLKGWTTVDGRPVTEGWEAVDGTIHLSKQASAGHIVSANEYGNFDLRFEWKMSKGGNSGIKYRVRQFGKSVLGCEYQILDDGGHPDGQTPNRSAGSFFDVCAPVADKQLNPVGEYNSGRIVVRGDHVQHWLNGDLVLSLHVGDTDWDAMKANSKFSKVLGFGENSNGKIMLTDHGDEVWYRNVKITAHTEPIAVDGVALDMTK